MKPQHDDLALSLLAAYLMGRVTGLSDSDINSEISQKTPRGFRKARKFLNGLDPTQQETLRKYFQKQLKLIHPDVVTFDRGFLQPLFDKTGINIPKTSTLDRRIEDFYFLRALGLNPYEAEFQTGAKKLTKLVAGFWLLLRYATGEETETQAAPYKASLMCVHELSYMHKDGGQIKTLTPHFTLRARHKSGNDLVKTHGRLMLVNDEITFFGTRVEGMKQMLTRITWEIPKARETLDIHDEEKPRMARGIVMTPNSKGVTLAGPLVACELPHTRQLLRTYADLTEGAEESVALSACYEAERLQFESLVDFYSRDSLMSQVGPHANVGVLEKALDHLEGMRSLVSSQPGLMGGNYFARPLVTPDAGKKF